MDKQETPYMRACLNPPISVLENGPAQIDVGFALPIVVIGLFLTSMLVIVSEINGGLSTLYKYSIIFLGFTTIMIMIAYNQYRTFTSYDELRKI